MINQTRVLNVLSDINKYEAAVDTFYDQYKALPGDFSQASEFWPATSSGNENGNIEDNTAKENILFWQHLSSAGLLEHNYNGLWTGSFQREINVPSSAIDSMLFSILYTDGSFFSDGLHTGNKKGNFLGSHTGSTWGGLKPTDAFFIDKELDDGLPFSGAVRIKKGSSSCTTGNEYNMKLETVQCAQFFRLDPTRHEY